MKKHALSIVAIAISTLSLAVSAGVLVSAKSQVNEKYATESQLARNKEIADSKDEANFSRIQGLRDVTMRLSTDVRLLKEHTGYKAPDAKN